MSKFKKEVVIALERDDVYSAELVARYAVFIFVEGCSQVLISVIGLSCLPRVGVRRRVTRIFCT